MVQGDLKLKASLDYTAIPSQDKQKNLSFFIKLIYKITYNKKGYKFSSAVWDTLERGQGTAALH